MERVRLLTVEELAQELNVKVSWIYAQTRLKGPDAIPRLRVGKYLRFVLEEVLAWLKHRQDSEF